MSVFDYVKSLFKETYDVELKQTGKVVFDKWAIEYGCDEVVTAVEIACEQYDDPKTAIHKIEGILYNRRKVEELFKPETKSRRLNLLIYPTLLEKLKKISIMHRTSVNDLINVVLTEYTDEADELIKCYDDTFNE